MTEPNPLRVAARLERPSPYDQRRHVRHPVHIGAAVRVGERPSSPILVVDLSTSGCGVETRGHLDIGARVWLKLDGLQAWAARVAWTQDDRAGLTFDQPLHPAVVERYK